MSDRSRPWSTDDENYLIERRAEQVPYAEIGRILGRSPAACRDHHTRICVRNRVTAGPPEPEPERFTTGEYLEALRNPNLLDLRRLPQITFRYGEDHGNGNT